MRLRAYAKINLGLDVLRKREDGYHEVKMVMQTIRLYDNIELLPKKKPGITIHTNLPYVPSDERNIAYKAAKLLMDEFHVQNGLTIELKKVIPVAAGMAGGSSDAAAVLVGVNRLFNLGLSRKELMERAVQIGADVPYCVMRGTALAEGIGEKLTKLPEAPRCYVLVGKPSVSVSTKVAYGSLRLDEIEKHPDIDGIVEAIEKGNLQDMASRMDNVFEKGIIEKYPVIGQIKKLMEEQGALKALMSGSGPTVFGLFESREQMMAARKELEKSHLAKKVFATEILNFGGERV